MLRGLHTADANSVTVADAGELWIKRGGADGLEQSTIRQYHQHLDLHILPFLGELRGVNLLGIDSVMCPKARRTAAWQRLTQDLPMDKLDAMITEATLGDLPGLAGDILKGQIKGRVVVDVNG